jgi:hypothetical protein
MKFEYLSSNVIACEDFLPPMYLQDIKIELLNNRKRFNTPVWTVPKKENNGGEFEIKKQFFSHRCGGMDYWIEFEDIARLRSGEVIPDNEKIMGLSKWFYSQGLYAFIDHKNPRDVFQLLKRHKRHKIHVISYNNNGYYNWHSDSEFFTFNLILNEGDALSGGDLFFMDDSKIIKVPNKNNMMVLFPWYINHSITPIRSKNGKDVPFPQQRFSIQFWVDL